MVTIFLLLARRMRLWSLLRYFILLSTVALWIIASEYLVMLRLLILFNSAKPCRKCVFQEGESGIVELSFIFYEAIGYR